MSDKLTYRRAAELQRKVCKRGVSSLTPEERVLWPQAKTYWAQLAANPAYRRTVAAMQRQWPAYKKAEKILGQLPLRDRARYSSWTPEAFLRVHGARPCVRPATVSRATRPRRTRASRAHSPGRQGDDEPEPAPPRACLICGGSLEGKRSHAETCSPRCRTAKHRAERRLSAAEREALDRYAQALRIVRQLSREERVDLLGVVVWPRDAWLSSSSLPVAA